LALYLILGILGKTAVSLLDYQAGSLRLSGQHEELILVRSGGEIERIDTIDLGFPIGLHHNIAEFIGEREMRLHPGDGVVLYTDGITEAENQSRKLYGIDRLCQIISQTWQSSAAEIRQAVIADVYQHIDSHRIFDDITLVVLKQR